MHSNSKHTVKELEGYIHLYIREGISYKKRQRKYGLLLARANFNDKVLRYQEHGSLGIQSNTINNCTVKNLKIPL